MHRNRIRRVGGRLSIFPVEQVLHILVVLSIVLLVGATIHQLFNLSTFELAASFPVRVQRGSHRANCITFNCQIRFFAIKYYNFIT